MEKTGCACGTDMIMHGNNDIPLRKLLLIDKVGNNNLQKHRQIK